LADIQFPCRRSRQLADPAGEKYPVLWGQIKRLQRRAAGRHAVPERQIGAAGGANEQVGAPVLVEEHHMRIMLLKLRQHEVEEHRFARARRAANKGVAEIAVMEIEIERRS